MVRLTSAQFTYTPYTLYLASFFIIYFITFFLFSRWAENRKVYFWARIKNEKNIKKTGLARPTIPLTLYPYAFHFDFKGFSLRFSFCCSSSARAAVLHNMKGFAQSKRGKRNRV